MIKSFIAKLRSKTPCLNTLTTVKKLLCLKRKFVYSNNTHGCAIVEVPFDTVIEYNEFLEDIINSLQDDDKIETFTIIQHGYKTSFMYAWLTEPGGYYMDHDEITNELDRFFGNAIEIIDFIDTNTKNFNSPKLQMLSFRLRYYLPSLEDIAKVLSEK